MYHKIKSAAPLPGYTLRVCFSDGTSIDYAVSQLFARIEAFQTFLSVPGLFDQVRVDPGGYGISWNDDLDLDGEELWTNGTRVQTPFNQLLSFADATELWGLHDSTLRKAVSVHRLVEGVDVQKFGKQWVVTYDAMLREYGPRPKQD